MATTDGNIVSEVVPLASNCVYTSCYCEENIWKLASLLQEKCPTQELSQCFCIFISNDARQIPLWHQKASKNAERIVMWDYHVILIYHTDKKTLVYDLDTELSFPCPLQEYYMKCIRDEKTFKSEYKRHFRIIRAEEYLQTFASDRSHMINEKGEWIAAPPKYPPISCKDSTNNIQEFISMSAQYRHGQVFDLQGLLYFFHTKDQR